MPIDPEQWELAARHLVEAQERIMRQRELIKTLDASGHDTAQAAELLEIFEETLRFMAWHYDFIIRDPKE